ncbi:MAG: hypothetical protein QOG67_628 [Verrucomicrobiota bacterium]|jgi:hypothetical protein
MIMRMLSVSLVSVAVFSTWGADVLPKRNDFSRYQSMLDHSPFAVATAAALPAATPSFAKDLYIANAARSPEGDMVTLASAADKNFKEYLTTKGPNEHGYAIASIEWSDKVGATKVTVSKDGQFSSVGFNQALLSQGPGAGGSGPQPMPSYQPNQVPTPVTRPAVPGQVVPTPPPRVRGVIPRNPNAAPAPPPQVATPPPAAEE